MDFAELGIAPRMAAKLAEQNITDPTPIQIKAIPLALEGRDVMGLAQTGTGKTAAFGLPLLQTLNRIGEKPAPKCAAGLILAPTRELAKQIMDNLRSYNKGSHLKITLVVGGVSLNRQIDTMKRGVHIMVATPGRLIDLIERKAVDLSATRFLVLDEADQMLDMGFIHALRRIAPLLSADRQTMLFSATMPKQMEELSRAYLDNPVRVEVARPGQAAEKVDQEIHFIKQSDKQDLLIRLLKSHKGEKALVFTRTKHGAERLMKNLVRTDLKAASIHGNKSQGQRDRAIAAFKSGEITVLVATDVAARGIDIKAVEYVYNFELPNVPENYVHRIGRTARAGASGKAISFCSEVEMGELRDIAKVLKTTIPVASGEPWTADEIQPRPKRQPNRGKRRPQGKGRRPQKKAA